LRDFSGSRRQPSANGRSHYPPANERLAGTGEEWGHLNPVFCLRFRFLLKTAPLDRD
jgi:hypothetical protein